MKNRFDLIIFDWDGTLIDTIDWIAHCLQVAGNQGGYCVPALQAAKDVIGLCIDSAIETLYPEADSASRRNMVKTYSELYASRPLSRGDLFPGVFEMLIDLENRGFKLAVATGKTRKGLNHALAATETEAIFSITRCADETASKPNPRMLHEIMENTRIQPERTLMIGDSVHDLQMAYHAGIASVGLTCGANDAVSLRKFDPLLCLDQPADLWGYFN
jgi:phosphoglycolate phosphatase